MLELTCGEAMSLEGSTTALPDEAKQLLDRLMADPEQRIEVLRTILGEGACRQLGIYPIPAGFKLSVVIPVFNEKNWIREIVRRVQEVRIPKEIILVDDFSTDGTRKILKEEMEKVPNIKSSFTTKIRAKGGSAYRVSSMSPATWSSFRMPTSNMTRLNIPDSFSRSSKTAPMWSSGRFIGDCHRVLYYWHSSPIGTYDAVELVHQSEPDRHGDLL